MALFTDETKDHESTGDDIKENGSKLKVLIKLKSLTPISESLHTPSSLTLLSETLTSPPKLPSPVLTKQNSKEWSIKDFNEYEKQLKERIIFLQSCFKKAEYNDISCSNINMQQPIDYASKKKRKRRHSSISFQNFEEWSPIEMNQYEKEILAQVVYLSKQDKAEKHSIPKNK